MGAQAPLFPQSLGPCLYTAPSIAASSASASVIGGRQVRPRQTIAHAGPPPAQEPAAASPPAPRESRPAPGGTAQCASPSCSPQTAPPPSPPAAPPPGPSPPPPPAPDPSAAAPAPARSCPRTTRSAPRSPQSTPACLPQSRDTPAARSAPQAAAAPKPPWDCPAGVGESCSGLRRAPSAPSGICPSGLAAAS